MNTRHTLFRLGTLFAVLILASCTGVSDMNAGTGGETAVNCTVTAGGISTSSYTITWNPVSDQDLSGYRIYYGVTAPLTKYNALGYVSIDLNTTSVQFAPDNYNITTCTQAYIGVSALGNTKPESAMSEVQTLVIE